MTLISEIQNNDQLERYDLKTVKNAHIFSSNGVIYCKHYDTIIFAYNTQEGKGECRMNLSMTSNRQIHFLIDGLGLSNDCIIDLEKGHEKWSCSVDRQ